MVLLKFKVVNIQQHKLPCAKVPPSRLDLRLPTLIASECIRLSRLSPRTSAAAEMLNAGLLRLATLSHPRKSITLSYEFRAWIQRRPNVVLPG